MPAPRGPFRIGAAAGLVALVVAVFWTGLALALAPPPVRVSSNHLYVKATRGSYCYFRTSGNTAVGECGDAIYPLPTRGELPVHGRSRVGLHVGTRATRVDIALIRVEGDEFDYVGRSRRADPSDSTGRHWHARLPRHLRGANVLDVSVRYPHGGGSDNWAGIR
jgi:hypothetical protein